MKCREVPFYTFGYSQRSSVFTSIRWTKARKYFIFVPAKTRNLPTGRIILKFSGQLTARE